MKVESHKISSEYKYGFVTDVETESVEKGLSEEVIRTISRKKNEPINYYQNKIEPTILFNSLNKR